MRGLQLASDIWFQLRDSVWDSGRCCTSNTNLHEQTTHSRHPPHTPAHPHHQRTQFVLLIRCQFLMVFNWVLIFILCCAFMSKKIKAQEELKLLWRTKKCTSHCSHRVHIKFTQMWFSFRDLMSCYINTARVILAHSQRHLIGQQSLDPLYKHNMPPSTLYSIFD